MNHERRSQSTRFDRPRWLGYKCWAFISYSHQDNLATRGDDGSAWGDLRHEQFETSVIPKGYLTPRATPMGRGAA